MGFYLLLIIVVSFFSVQPAHSDYSSNNTEKTYGKEYFPWKEKAQMLFDSNLGKTTLSIQSKNGKSVYFFESGSITYKQHFRFLSKGIYLLKTENKAYWFGNSVYYKKPVLRLPFPLTIGQKWNWEGYEYSSEEDSARIVFTGEVMSEGEINLPAGKFTALKVKTKILYSNGNVEKLTEWYVPNIGMVKFEAEGKGSGVSGMIRKIFGLQTITFELKEG